MEDARRLWLQTVAKYKLNPDGPGSDGYWCPDLETCTRDRLREIQSEKLEVLCRFLYDCSPFYRRKFDEAKLKPRNVKSVDDLPKVPLTTKAEMAQDVLDNPPWGTYLTIDEEIWRSRGWMVFSTGGTTAAPRPFRHTYHDRDVWAWNHARVQWAAGVRSGDCAFLASAYGPHVFYWGMHYGFGLLGVPVIPGGGMDTKRRAYFIDRFKPTILGATPSYALYLGNTMKAMGLDPAQSSIRIITTGGEPGACIPATKKRIESLWGAQLHDYYGCTEAAPCASGYSCLAEVAKPGDEPMNIHLREDTEIWELVNPVTLEPVPEGQRGISVCTNLFSEAAPLLRFLVGDYSVFTSEPCACGRRHARAIGGFCGRADDMLNIRGITLFPSAVEDILRGIDSLADEFQIVISTVGDMDTLTIKVEASENVSADSYDDLAKTVMEEVKSKTEIRPDVQVVAYGSLPKTEFKAKRVTDLR
ncbi:MAG: AMP-binding protein [Chloroflexi bacterium]|nr:AMP-binding protein [Chloroflexota bacterium]